MFKSKSYPKPIDNKLSRYIIHSINQSINNKVNTNMDEIVYKRLLAQVKNKKSDENNDIYSVLNTNNSITNTNNLIMEKKYKHIFLINGGFAILSCLYYLVK